MNDAQPVPAAFVQALRELGLTRRTELTGWPLTGGVSSDIWCLDTERGIVCAKRALAKLRVAADWRAPVARNRYEACWMRLAQQAAPGSAPELLGQHDGLGVLVMGYLGTLPLWKQQLRDGQIDAHTVAAVGALLVRIHAYSAARPALAVEFDSQAIFFDIRLEPYLLATAARHADRAEALHALVDSVQANARALVHGDVSPKNILVGPGGPVLLDAECAVWSDPAFDLAFCLNHLLLKSLWNPAAAPRLMIAFDHLAAAYLAGVDWEEAAELQRRAAHLLPGLLLARVDGKSPVEYLDSPAQRERVRSVARARLREPVDTLRALRETWESA
jgi:tRNA A-37 threonylcarbamoyl transferase component Bud32